MTPEAAAPPLTLADLALHVPATVAALAPPPHAPEWGQRLAEIGFIEGEAVKLLARAWPGHDPLVVRIGDSTFALRRAEAACVRVLAVS